MEFQNKTIAKDNIELWNNITKQNTTEMRFISFALLLFCACQFPNNSNEGWQKVYQNDENGVSSFGHKSALMSAVRLGYPIRLGWGSNRVEHVADADFLTIFDGDEVFAQIKTIIGQAPRIDGDSLKIRFRAENHWAMIAGTNDYVDLPNITLLKTYLKLQTTSDWCKEHSGLWNFEPPYTRPVRTVV